MASNPSDQANQRPAVTSEHIQAALKINGELGNRATGREIAGMARLIAQGEPPLPDKLKSEIESRAVDTSAKAPKEFEIRMLIKAEEQGLFTPTPASQAASATKGGDGALGVEDGVYSKFDRNPLAQKPVAERPMTWVELQQHQRREAQRLVVEGTRLMQDGKTEEAQALFQRGANLTEMARQNVGIPEAQPEPVVRRIGPDGAGRIDWSQVAPAAAPVAPPAPQGPPPSGTFHFSPQAAAFDARMEAEGLEPRARSFSMGGGTPAPAQSSPPVAAPPVVTLTSKDIVLDGPPARVESVPPAPAIATAAFTPPQPERHGPGDGDNPQPVLTARAANAKPDVKNTLVIQEAMARCGEDLGKTGKNRNGVDGDWGPKTQAAFEKVCKEAGVDPSKVDLSKQPTPETTKLMAHLGTKILERDRDVAVAKEAKQEEVQTRMAAAEAAPDRVQRNEPVVVGELCAPNVPNCKGGGTQVAQR